MKRIEKIEWDDIYLIGIPEIDMHHKRLLTIANDLYDIASGSAEDYKEKMAQALKALVAYIEYHFSEEENFMSKYDYPSCATHKIAHEAFATEVTRQLYKLNDGNKENVLLFYSFVVNWILTHVARADKVWARFVKPRIA